MKLYIIIFSLILTSCHCKKHLSGEWKYDNLKDTNNYKHGLYKRYQGHFMHKYSYDILRNKQNYDTIFRCTIDSSWSDKYYVIIYYNTKNIYKKETQTIQKYDFNGLKIDSLSYSSIQVVGSDRWIIIKKSFENICHCEYYKDDFAVIDGDTYVVERFFAKKNGKIVYNLCWFYYPGSIYFKYIWSN